MASLTLRKLALVCLVSSTAPSTKALATAISSAHALGILQGRQTSSCPVSDHVRCPDSKLPSDFCCPADSTCISLDSSSSALCCPKDGDCSKIAPVSCDLGFQDVFEVPDAAVKTTRLRDRPSRCGRSTCCPFGYTCDDDDQCVLVKATSSIDDDTPSTSDTETTSSPKPSATDDVTNKPIAGGDAPLCSKFPGAAIVVGFFPGLLIGAIITLAVLYVLSRRGQNDQRPPSKDSAWSSYKGSTPSGRNQGNDVTVAAISHPIPMMQGGTRTDFLRRQPSVLLRSGASRAKSWFGSSKTSPTLGNDYEKHHSPLNPINHWKTTTPPDAVKNNASTAVNGQSNVTVPPGNFTNTVPMTPPSQVHGYAEPTSVRAPSTESIKVYSPPELMRSASRSGFTPASGAQHGGSGMNANNTNGSTGVKYNIMEMVDGKAAPAPPPQPNNASGGATCNARISSVIEDDGEDDNYIKINTHGPSETIPRTSSPTLPANPMAMARKNHYHTGMNAMHGNSSSSAYPAYLPSTRFQQSVNPNTVTSKSPPSASTRPPPPSQSVQPQQQQTPPIPASRPLTHMTTFTDVLRDAGLERSEKYASGQGQGQGRGHGRSRDNERPPPPPIPPITRSPPYMNSSPASKYGNHNDGTKTHQKPAPAEVPLMPRGLVLRGGGGGGGGGGGDDDDDDESSNNNHNTQHFSGIGALARKTTTTGGSGRSSNSRSKSHRRTRRRNRREKEGEGDDNMIRT